MRFKIRSRIVCALGLKEEDSFFVRDFPTREDADKWCKDATAASHPMWWGDGNFYKVVEEIQ